MNSIPDSYKPEHWRNFLSDILDGFHDGSIRKIGSAAAFVNNQLNASTGRHRARQAFLEGLSALLNSYEFSAVDALRQPIAYTYLVRWIETFLKHEPKQLYRVYSLFADLMEMRGKRQALSIETSQDLTGLLWHTGEILQEVTHNAAQTRPQDKLLIDYPFIPG
ncbi:hypothetical protein [Spirosoma areae]